jgi:hypothetical protein
VDESTFSLAVVTFGDRQNGQAVGISRPVPSSSPAMCLFTLRV